MAKGITRRLTSFLFILTINVGILAVLDLALVKLDLLSPPLAFGVGDLGFGYSGVLKSSRFGVPHVDDRPDKVTIAMVGDSHSQLVFKNRLDSHEFVLEGA